MCSRSLEAQLKGSETSQRRGRMGKTCRHTVCQDEEPRQAFYRMPYVNSMPAISIITCGGRCFEVRTLVIMQLTNSCSKWPKNELSVRAGRVCIAVQPADLVIDLPHRLSPRLTMIIGRVEEGR